MNIAWSEWPPVRRGAAILFSVYFSVAKRVSKTIPRATISLLSARLTLAVDCVRVQDIAMIFPTYNISPGCDILHIYFCLCPVADMLQTFSDTFPDYRVYMSCLICCNKSHFPRFLLQNKWDKRFLPTFTVTVRRSREPEKGSVRMNRTHESFLVFSPLKPVSTIRHALTHTHTLPLQPYFAESRVVKS